MSGHYRLVFLAGNLIFEAFKKMLGGGSRGRFCKNYLILIINILNLNLFIIITRLASAIYLFNFFEKKKKKIRKKIIFMMML